MGRQKIMANETPLFNVKVILAGDGAVGKSSLLRRYIFHDFIEQHKMTIAMDSYSKVAKVPGLGPVKVHLWDLAGQPQWAAVREGFYLGAHAMALVFDVSRAETIKGLPNWILECRKKAPGIPVLVVANKIDLPPKVPLDKIAKWVKDNQYELVTTSPKTGFNIELMFEKLGIMGVNFVLKRR